MTSSAYNFSDQLITQPEIKKELKKRNRVFQIQSVPIKKEDEFIKENWHVVNRRKTRVVLSKPKTNEAVFNDQIWSLFANLGFTFLNNGENILIPFYDDPSSNFVSQIFAADEEAIIIVLTKIAVGDPKESNFKADLLKLSSRKEQIINTVKRNFSNSKHKIKFILATKNYYLSESDKEIMEKQSIIHFDEEMAQYYVELNKHLGLSARFQLLANLFEGQIIPQLDNVIPAIQGKMGGHTYYSFSIEPDKLLKIGYVLHRNKANKKLMPTYQRIIKKGRLKLVQEFVENGGFFPNSIIINVNAPKGLRFEKANTQVEDAISKIGILHLPKTYRSSFIIDGQHRLYGYVNSEFKTKNSIPVVAFVNLDRNQQIKLFMQINENQKSVPKNLRNTLNADLLWNSDDYSDSIKALKLQIAQDLGEDLDSPLYDRVIIGENQKTHQRCITIDTIKLGLDRSNFFGTFTKNGIKTRGAFYAPSNDEMYDSIMPFLKGCFNYIKTGLKDEWEKGEEGDGFISINAGIESLIRIFSDITDHISKSHANIKLAKLLDQTTPFLEPLITRLSLLTGEEKNDLRKSYGTAGRSKYWRTLQKIIHQSKKDFVPAGFTEYIKNEAKQFNEDSFKMIRDIETFMKQDFRERLEKNYGNSWFKKGVPETVYEAASLRAIQKNKGLDEKDEVGPWDCLNMIDYRRIATYQSNWKDIFEKHYTIPGQEKIRGGKEEKTDWFQKLERIRNQNFHSYSVKEEEFDFLTELYNWLIVKSTQNSFQLADV